LNCSNSAYDAVPSVSWSSFVGQPCFGPRHVSFDTFMFSTGKCNTFVARRQVCCVLLPSYYVLFLLSSTSSSTCTEPLDRPIDPGCPQSRFVPSGHILYNGPRISRPPANIRRHNNGAVWRLGIIMGTFRHNARPKQWKIFLIVVDDRGGDDQRPLS
jgi:hypothetical protein